MKTGVKGLLVITLAVFALMSVTGTALAAKTLKRGTGARGLRAVIEELMREILFEIPSRSDVREVVITRESVEDDVPPLLVLRPEVEKKEA